MNPMKLKDILIIENKPKIKLHKKYEDFINNPDIANNSIEIDEHGHIISDQLSVLKFIDFLLQEYPNLDESKNYNKIKNEKKSKKNKRKKLKKRIKNMNDFRTKNSVSNSGNNLDYHRRIGNSQDFNSTPYFNQPFSSSGAGSLENIPNVESEE